MKRLWLILFVFPIFAQETEKEDSTFVLLKSGEIKQIHNSQAYIHFVNPLQMDIEIVDKDSIIYDIYDIDSVQDAKGKIVLGKTAISLLKVTKAILQSLSLVGLIWVIIY